VTTRSVIRWSGAAGIGGGVLWCLFAALASLEPVGCIAATCAFRPVGYTTDLAPLMIVAVVLLLSDSSGCSSTRARWAA
jgi:hypothetical protein